MNKKRQWEDFLPAIGTKVVVIINKGLSVEEKRELYYQGCIMGDYRPETVRFTETFDTNQSDMDYSVLIKFSDISEWKF